MIMSSLKADPALAFVPIIVVSIIDDTGAGFALGASEYLVKPVDLRSPARYRSCCPPPARAALRWSTSTPTHAVMATRQ